MSTNTTTPTGTGTSTNPAQPPVTADGSRPARSRKNRPCDRCRRAKTRCSIGAAGPPCSQCAETRRSCTFELAPPVRRKPMDEFGKMSMSREYEYEYDFGRSETPNTTVHTNANTHSHTPRGQDEGDGWHMPSSASASAPASVHPASAARSTAVTALSPRQLTSGAGSNKRQKMDHPHPSLPVSSFDNLTSSNFDPQVLTVVLTDDLLPIADAREDGAHPHVRQISADPKRPIFVLMQPKSDNSKQPVAGAIPLGHIRTLLHHHPNQITEAELHHLYRTKIHPALPILPNGRTEDSPPLLLGAILASAMSHSRNTRHLAASVAGLLGVGGSNLAENNLAGVASAVLELGMRPTNSSWASYLALAKTIALAQLLGMHINPLRWSIPPWEQELRIRLWWTLAIHDAWMSFLNSRPCHIQAHNATVPLPHLSSVLEASCAHASASSDSSKSFIGSCKLAALVRRLQSEVCTLAAVGEEHIGSRKASVQDLIRKVEDWVLDWRDVAFGTRVRPTGVNSFLIHLLGFRCMLKRIHIELEYGLGSAFNPEPEMFAVFTDCVNFIVNLSEADIDGYYLIYTSHIISSLTSSLIRLSLSDPASLNTTAMDLVTRLLQALQRFQKDYNWDLAGPALRRAASMSARLTDMDEHLPLAAALRGQTAPVIPPQSDLANLANVATMPVVPPSSSAAPMTMAMEPDPQVMWDWSGVDWNFADLLGRPDAGVSTTASWLEQ